MQADYDSRADALSIDLIQCDRSLIAIRSTATPF